MIKNQIKTVLFLGILSGILLVIGRLIGGTQGLAVALIFAILMNIGSYFFSHKLILLMYRAKEVSKEDNPALHEMVEEICKEANIPKPKIYIVPTEAPNAFACGPSPKKAVVAVTKGILNLLNKEELKGVLAHEIAHVKNRDILIATIAATIASVITYLAYMAQFATMFGGANRNDERGGGNIIGLLFLAILAPLAATLIQLAISRSREFIADETGARLIKKAEPLAKALEKLESGAKHHPLRLGTESTNNLFIVNPFRGGKAFLTLFMTHPATNIRVQRLRNLNL